ncbi:hypothetical protein ACE1B6_04720 [Aerosakkonemataceae cyanobacterium BLCC-F154]|uniref:Uncharacterized protein n=1 Tax=Floridaenema fluviatile BLCC-F154 TaxID=3153640 RepID=A0ABV4Y9H5_9CYAN
MAIDIFFEPRRREEREEEDEEDNIGNQSEYVMRDYSDFLSLAILNQL